MEGLAGFELHAAPARSERTSFAAVEARLRAYAEHVLASASVSAADRADIAEEIYGHLWYRWQSSMAAGRSEAEAVNEALGSFGEVASIAQEFTATYRGRLFASTIGVLLPVVAPDTERPRGVRAIAGLLVFLAGFMLVVGGATFVSMSPIRALVGIVVVLAGAALDLLAAAALMRGQRWALLYGQFTLVVVLVSGIATSWTKFAATPSTIEIPALAIVGALLLPFALGSRIAAWVRGSHRLGRALAFGLVAATALTATGASFVAAVPDPTQVGPSALDFRLSVSCERTGAQVSSVTITTDATWSRVDLLPNGPFGTGTTRDEIAVWIDGIPTFDASIGLPGITLGSGWSLHGTTIDYAPGEAARPDPTDIGWSSADVSPDRWSTLGEMPSAADAPLTNSVPDIEFAQSVRTGAIRSGHRYHAVWRGGAWAFDGRADLSGVVAVYNHGGRFAKRAVAGCGESAAGVEAPVAIP